MRVAPVFVVALLLASCGPAERPVTEGERAAIADTLRARIAAAHDFDAGGDQVERLMSLYPDGRVLSTSGGLISTTRDSLEIAVREFWESVGVRMQNPTFRWDETHVDVLSRNAAVLTGRFSIPHVNPQGDPHTVSGVWTAVFERRDGEWMVVQEHLWGT